MSASSSYSHEVVPLPESVETIIRDICQRQSQPAIKNYARRLLAEIGEQASMEVLEMISSQRIYSSFSGYIATLVKQYYPTQASLVLSGFQSSPASLSSVWSPSSTSPVKSPQNQNAGSQSPESSFAQNGTRSNLQRTLQRKIRLSFEDETPLRGSPSIRPQSPFTPDANNSQLNGVMKSTTVSEQLLILSRLEFRKLFLVLSYIGREKLEAVISLDGARDIFSMKDLPMTSFESEIWYSYGGKCCDKSDRSEYFDWDSGKTHLYYCHVHQDGSYHFKGPYLNSTRTHLQRCLGDDNVLIVKFLEDGMNDIGNISEGIIVGLRRYRFFVFKEERKRQKKIQIDEQIKYSSVKCFFVRIDSVVPCIEDNNYILYGKSVTEARSLFMHTHKVSTMEKYMARFSLILSKTIKLHIDFDAVKVETIEDIPFVDENGDIILDDGKPLWHTDGTGFISEDLAMKCPKDFSAAMYIKGNSFETRLVDARSNDPPLLMQCRLFYNGYAVKGTFLLNKKLEQGTIQIRPSMIKVERDHTFTKEETFNSLEIVAVSRKPGRTTLSKQLIALLSYGNVPPEFFLSLLINAVEDTQNMYTNRKSALKVAVNNDGLEYGFLAQRMIFSGIPLNEPYLQHCLWNLEKDENSRLKAGKLPISETFYLMGTADPTGILNYDEVCIILHHGPVSWEKVLVYRSPGLHFGDIHVMKAKYVKELVEIVGNAKYGIFFSTKGGKSAPYEMATGDFDGDMYWVSRNPELLKYYQASEPWSPLYSSQNSNNRKPQEFSSVELESELLRLFVEARRPSFVTATAADSWLSFMDRLLTIQCASEKDCLRRKIIQLIYIYYDALDAPKSGKKVNFPNELKAEQYPHYMQRRAHFTYNSFSILGQIYNRMEQSKAEASSKREIWKLPCFNVQIPEEYVNKWRIMYSNYRKDMTIALKSGSEARNDAADEVIKKYKQMLYDAPDMEESPKNTEQVYEEAVAIYHVTYDYAISCNEVGKCGFCWRVAGSALFNLYAWKIAGPKERPLVILPSVLRELLN